MDIWARLGDVSSDRYLVGIAVLMVLLGILVPRKFLTEARKEADYWRSAFFKAIGQNDKLLDKHDVGIATLKSLEKRAEQQAEQANAPEAGG